jgi:hypothetical protein
MFGSCATWPEGWYFLQENILLVGISVFEGYHKNVDDNSYRTVYINMEKRENWKTRLLASEKMTDETSILKRYYENVGKK